MKPISITIKSFQDFDDERVAKQFQALLDAASTDCLKRPLEEKPRIVTIQLELRPQPDTDADGVRCTRVKGQVQMKSTLPPMVSKPLSFRLFANGKMAYNPDSPDNVDQGTFTRDDEDEDR